jgi:hypothetical protein
VARRFFAAVLCAALVLLMQTGAFASFYESGDYSSSVGPYEFRFEPDDAVLVYYGEGFYYPYDDVWVGSELYVPVYCDEDDELATMEQVEEADAGVTYKATRMVDGVELVDVPEDFNELLDPGVYARVTFSDDYPEISGTSMDVKLILTVDGVADQDTMAAFRDELKNPVVDLHRNSAYTATRPTVFRTDRYSGEAVFDFGDNIHYNAVVERDSRYFMKLDRSEIVSLSQMYKKAYLEYYDFVGEHDGSLRDGEIEIPVDREDFRPKRNAQPQIYVYRYTNGNLTAMDASEVSFDSRLDVVKIKTNDPETYILAAEPLLEEVDESPNEILKVGYQENENAEPPLEPSAPEAPPEDPGIPPPPVQGDADNPATGGDDINVTNQGSENPSTSDSRVIWPVSLLAVASSGALVKLSRKGKQA